MIMTAVSASIGSRMNLLKLQEFSVVEPWPISQTVHFCVRQKFREKPPVSRSEMRAKTTEAAELHLAKSCRVGVGASSCSKQEQVREMSQQRGAM